MDAQDRVREFHDEHDMDGEPEYQLLDLAAEVGELAADACDATEYGVGDGDVDVARDEVGDALFSLLSFANSLDVDADAALDEALAKYERRIEETGDPSSGD
ncbi:nucleotide pyrophosphohydrolase [Halorubellus sp. JP-L1]|uniref:MazG nucleotide pyrophosphohydrolase domain-containing protein n=1 Tax=Halorubellus sp. JP-L1 TaxID=2715753 RepID=UPI00140B4376|nr:MazG-like family protein [Halorubellus sp. JP-L1]NHN40302.1 nucleotide pyrophosphohydrolase [Halorubellus sp. JP-L1]